MSEEIRKINLKVKLSAYTRGVLPTKLSDLKNDVDAPIDGRLYGRKDGEWFDINDVLKHSNVIIEEGSGLDKIEVDKSGVKISVRKWEGKLKDLPTTLEDDKVYYVYEETQPDLFILGGTAYTDEDEDYGNIIYGGNASNVTSQLIFKPMNSKGEF